MEKEYRFTETSKLSEGERENVREEWPWAHEAI